MTRRMRAVAHGAGPRFAALAAGTVLASLVLAGAPGLASAQVVPSPDPTAAASSEVVAPASSSDLPATPTPSVTSSDAAPAASPSDTAAPTTSSPSVPVAPAPSTAESLSALAPVAADAPARLVGPMAYAPGTSATSPHGGSSPTTDQCATCHRAHTAKSSALLTVAAPQATLCFTCHDGTGALSDVQAYYTDPSVPANDPTTSSYYRHDALAVSSHSLAESDEFGGRSNRHSECSDCHNPHKPAGADASSSAGSPWLASGRLAGISGVAVTNGAAGAPPTSYTWLNGTTTSITYEYQLCFKCHSGYTQLPTNTSGKPSRDVLDVAVEFNPANSSFHPVEATGKNLSATMGLSLAGGTRWQLTVGDTVRCTQCHATATVPSDAAAGDSLAPHSSQFRGILVANYRDRVLRTSASGDAYNANDFALCYLCHSQSPFDNSGDTTATAFSEHNKHVRGIRGDGSDPSTDIDKAGAGMGNALCSECHFRTHGTGATAAQNPRGVEFAPDVEPFGGVISFTKTPGGGTCTLLCHGHEHDGEGYTSGVGG